MVEFGVGLGAGESRGLDGKVNRQAIKAQS
jgi:hypothetical protein